jgi:large subunit ribosomal protein L13
MEETTKFTSVEQAERDRKWFIVDASGVTLGRLASEVAALIRGKHKPTFTKHTDCGDGVIVVNAEKIRVTGKKLEDKEYHQHTGFIGHVKSVNLQTQLAKHPDRVIESAVFGMLPKGVLGKQSMRRRLKVFAGPDHKQAAQTPQKYELRYTKAVV